MRFSKKFHKDLITFMIYYKYKEGDAMNINIRGEKIEITPSIKDYIEEKLERINKYFENPEGVTAFIVVKVNNLSQTVEVTVPTKNFTLRREVSHADLYAAIDLVVDKLERQIRKNKTKIKSRYKNIDNFAFSTIETEEIEDEPIIAKRKEIETKPMDEEEAILQAELLGHDFFAFKNMNEDCVSVIYKRKDNSYGILNVR